MRTSPPPSITLCQPPTSYSGGRAFPKSYLKSRKPDPDGADLLVMDVDAFRPPFDVVDELTNNKSVYVVSKGDEGRWLTITEFPALCSVNITRMVEHIPSRPGKYPTISACISNAVRRMYTSDYMKTLFDLRRRFYLARNNVRGSVVYLMDSFFGSFEIQLPTGKRQGVNIPQDIYNGLTQLSDDLGMDPPKTAVLCVMITLSDQIEVNKDMAEEMETYVGKFLTMAEDRAIGCKALMEAYGLLEDEDETGAGTGAVR